MKKDIYARILRSERSVKARLVLCKALQYTTRQKADRLVVCVWSTRSPRQTSCGCTSICDKRTERWLFFSLFGGNVDYTKRRSSAHMCRSACNLFARWVRQRRTKIIVYVLMCI